MSAEDVTAWATAITALAVIITLFLALAQARTERRTKRSALVDAHWFNNEYGSWLIVTNRGPAQATNVSVIVQEGAASGKTWNETDRVSVPKETFSLRSEHDRTMGQAAGGAFRARVHLAWTDDLGHHKDVVDLYPG